MTAEKVYKFYTEDLAVRVSVVTCPELIREICAIHSTYPLATMAMGRLLTGTILMASQLADDQSLSVRLEGNGPLGHLYAEASFEGAVRGYIQNPQVDIAHLPSGHLDLKSGIGSGILAVTRNIPFQRQPQMGIVPITSGEIGQDIAFYLQQSHQIPSLVALSVSLDKEGEVTTAGGVILELIPGAQANVIKQIEAKAAVTSPLSEKLSEGMSPEELVKEYLHSSKIKTVEYPHTLKYTCRCSLERVENTLTLMGRATLSEMALKGEAVSVKCEFCGKSYQVPIARIRDLLQKL